MYVMTPKRLSYLKKYIMTIPIITAFSLNFIWQGGNIFDLSFLSNLQNVMIQKTSIERKYCLYYKHITECPAFEIV